MPTFLVLFSTASSMSYNFTTIPLTDHHTTIEFGLFQLRKFAKYVVAVRAFNRYGDGDLTPAVTVATLQDGEPLIIPGVPGVPGVPKCLEMVHVPGSFTPTRGKGDESHGSGNWHC